MSDGGGSQRPRCRTTENITGLARRADTSVAYRQHTAAVHQGILVGAGVPEPMARLFTDTDESIARGEVALTTGDLSHLIGRPTTPLTDTVAAALKAGAQR